MFQKSFFLSFSKNDFRSYTNNTPNTLFCFSYFNGNSDFKKIVYLISNLLFFNKNVLFVDNNVNYNYLPIHNNILFSRSYKKLYKIIKYFNIAVIFYIDLKKKKFIFKKLYNCNLINISISNRFISKKFDLNLGFINNYIHTYLFYLVVLNLYLKIKSN